MTTSDTAEQKPFWLLIEENILALDPQDLSGGNLEASVHRIAGDLDNAGFNVSGHGGNLLQLRWALDETVKVGRPLMEDLNTAIAAFTLENVADPYSATNDLLEEMGKTWPDIKKSDRRADVIALVEKAKLDLLVARAKDVSGDEGIRMLIADQVADDAITSALDITAEKLAQVHADIAKERAERARVETLLEAVEGKTNEEKVNHLFQNEVSEALIIEMAKVDQGVIDGVKKAMEEEIKEKQRLADEAAAKKKAEAAGPSLGDIPADEMLDHIEAIREIMEFSEEEKEIRVMCEQSSIPVALVDIAVSEPDRLDELEKEAEG